MVNCLSNIKSMQNNQVVITKKLLHVNEKNADEKKKMKWRFPQTERAQKNENIYLIKRKFASQKKQTIYYVSHFVVKSVYVISFPIQYCFLKAWILKNTIFMIKKYDFFFWWTKVKKKLCTNTRKRWKSMKEQMLYSRWFFQRWDYLYRK